MRIFLTASVAAVSTMILSGCSNMPSPMPRGYVSYNKPYKSAPGPHARDVGYEYSNEKNMTIMEDMRFAAQDLVDKLDQKLSFNVDEIYLKTPANTAFYNMMDHLLRDELTQRGYLLSNEPSEGTTHVELVANNAAESCADVPKDMSGDDYKTMYMALVMDVIDDVPQDLVEGFYDVPVFDYIPAGKIKIDNALCKAIK